MSRANPYLPLCIALLALSYFAVPVFARRAITFTEKVNDFDTAENDANFTSTDTWSFANTSVGICAVGNSDAAPGGGDTTPTLTQTGYTWTRIDGPRDFASDASPQFSITIFRAVGTGATAAALTADFGADSQTMIVINCFEITGADTGGSNAANAIVQFKPGVTDSGDPFSIAFDGAVTANNGGMFFAGCDTSTTWTAPDTGASVGTEIVTSAPVSEWKTQYVESVNTVDHNTMDWDFSANEACGGYAVEIKLAGGAAASGTAKNALMIGVGLER